MAKISLTQKPEFKAPVEINIKGEKPVPVVFTFKARTKDEMRAWLDSLQASAKDLHEAAMECSTGWELDDDFTIENLQKLEQNYMGSMQEIVNTYIDQQNGARRKN